MTLLASRAMAWAPLLLGSFSGTYSTKAATTNRGLAATPWITSSTRRYVPHWIADVHKDLVSGTPICGEIHRLQVGSGSGAAIR